jgi:hypothetical protein
MVPEVCSIFCETAIRRKSSVLRKLRTSCGGGHWRASDGLGRKGRTPVPELLQTLAQKEQGIGDALVSFAGFLNLALSHEVLELLVSAQPQHFLAATGGIPSPESRMNDAEKGFEFIGFRARKSRHLLLSDIVGATTGEGAEISCRAAIARARSLSQCSKHFEKSLNP